MNLDYHCAYAHKSPFSPIVYVVAGLDDTIAHTHCFDSNIYYNKNLGGLLCDLYTYDGWSYLVIGSQTATNLFNENLYR